MNLSVGWFNDSCETLMCSFIFAPSISGGPAVQMRPCVVTGIAGCVISGYRKTVPRTTTHRSNVGGINAPISQQHQHNNSTGRARRTAKRTGEQCVHNGHDPCSKPLRSCRDSKVELLQTVHRCHNCLRPDNTMRHNAGHGKSARTPRKVQQHQLSSCNSPVITLSN